MRHYFYLSPHHFASTTDLLWSWYRDKECDDVLEIARQHLNPDMQEWLHLHARDHDLRAYVVPFTEIKVLVGFRSLHNALLFKLTWL